MGKRNPFECTCDFSGPCCLNVGCTCGAAQAERALRDQRKKTYGSNRRDCSALGYLPDCGKVITVQRPIGSKVDHGGIPLAIWHKCNGKQFEVLNSFWEDQEESGGCVQLDVGTITGKQEDLMWFPLDGVIPA